MTTAPAVKKKVVGDPTYYERSDRGAQWCTGCGYPMIIRSVLEVLEEMDLTGEAVMLVGGGCHTGVPFAGGPDFQIISHGRATSQGTAMKRVRPDTFVFTMQGDGDAIAIGTEGLIHAAARGDCYTVIMSNNSCYGNTGGQMAPTTILGQVTSTTDEGRSRAEHGMPIRTAELVASLYGTAYSARTSVSSPANFQRTKKYLRTAFQKQLDKAGFSFVEILMMCPTNWHLSPLESLRWVDEKATREFPLGEFKNVDVLKGDEQ